MTKIVCLADMHGHLVPTPECDMLLLGGDLCPLRDHSVYSQQAWLNTEFRRWLEEQPAKFTVACAGNHDFIFQDAPRLVPQLPWTYLQDSGTEYNDLKIWGSPWQRPFFDWAFNTPEENLVKKWQLIPDDTDIFLLHSPPYGYGDLVAKRISQETEEEWPEPEHVGSPSLLERIKEIRPKLVIFGHVHTGAGIYHWEDTTLINASLVNEKYHPVHQVVEIEIEK